MKNHLAVSRTGSDRCIMGPFPRSKRKFRLMPEAASPRNLYALHETRRLRLRVYYPSDCDQLVLHTDLDWDKDILPSTIDRSASFAEFNLETTRRSSM